MDQIKNLLASLSIKQKLSIVAIVLALGGGISWFVKWQHEQDFKPLYTSLAPEDAGAIVAKLKEKGVEYRLTSNGTTVAVPEPSLAEMRLEMAGIGLPKTGRIGFEIFDKTNFAMTDFAEHVNYRRAIEGELERSVMSIGEVEQARVHVTFPKESVFLESREPAKASVLVRLKPGAQMSPQNVAAVTHLVASAVEGLSPESVSVVDMRGNLLNRTHKFSADDSGLSPANLEYQNGIENELTAKINQTLELLVGPGKFHTGVSVDCDLNSGEQSEETFDPSKSVMLTSQKTEDAPAGATSIAGGVPGTASNLPDAPQKQNANARGQVRRTENVTYQSSRVVRHLKLSQGSIKRMSISVLLDQDVKWNGKGQQMERVLVPPTPEKLKTIHDVIATLVGFSMERGDQLTVDTLPFEATLNSEPPMAEPVAKDQKAPAKGFALDKKMITWIASGAGVLVLGGILLIMLRRRKRTAVVPAAAALPPGTAPRADLIDMPQNSSQAAAIEAAASEPAALLSKRTEALTPQMQESARKEAETWALVLKAWMAEEALK